VVWVAAFLALPLLPVVAVQRGPRLGLDAPWLVGVWAAGCLVAAIPLLRGLLGLRRLRAEAVVLDADAGVLCSGQLASPVTWGLLRPLIVMPADAEGWPAGQRDAALAHERAHIARRDWAVHVYVWVVSVLFWFHPAVWWARRALAREAEHAADDVVLAHGVRPSDYAELLLRHACPRGAGAALGVAPSQVALRVRAVLAPRSRSARRWPAWVGAVALWGLLLPTLGAWPLWTLPDESLTCQPGPLP
jgi:beta-lactamase regulating signal transducer with metallopeptidase domain